MKRIRTLLLYPIILHYSNPPQAPLDPLDLQLIQTPSRLHLDLGALFTGQHADGAFDALKIALKSPNDGALPLRPYILTTRHAMPIPSLLPVLVVTSNLVFPFLVAHPPLVRTNAEPELGPEGRTVAERTGPVDGIELPP